MTGKEGNCVRCGNPIITTKLNGSIAHFDSEPRIIMPSRLGRDRGWDTRGKVWVSGALIEQHLEETVDGGLVVFVLHWSTCPAVRRAKKRKRS